MGVDVTTYLCYGMKIDSKKFDDDFKKNNPDQDDWFDILLPEIEGHSDIEFDVIDDNMSGKYIVIGKIIESTDRYESDFYTISVEKLPDPDKLLEAINNKLNSNYERSDFRLLFFNHFH